jgi:AAA domain, putative AbiEii toxin, Type IV TA system
MVFMKFKLEEKVWRSNTGSVITELSIGNFKAFGETQRVPIKPLTLIFGANSSGKSSIIHGLLLAHHALKGGMLDAYHTALGAGCVDLGGFRQYVHRHELGRQVSLHLEKPAPELSVSDTLAQKEPWGAAFGGAKRVGLTFHIGLRAGEAEVPQRRPDRVILRLEVQVNGRVLLELEGNEASGFKTVDPERPYLDAIVRGITEDVLTTSYLGPVRCVPSRHFDSIPDQDPSWRANGTAAWEQVRMYPKVFAAVNEWLGPKRLGTNYRMFAPRILEDEEPLQALREKAGLFRHPPDLAAGELLPNEITAVTDLSFEDTKSKTVVSHRDLGFGINQILPVLITALAERQTLIAIEQPELHLHPALQAQIGDVFIESALGEQRNTFLLETHSEHLILRIMRRIRETASSQLPPGALPVRPGDVSILYVERDGDHSIVREMPLNERGELIKAWPGGFFEEGFRELFS